MANSVDPDETPRSAASHLGLQCLLRPVCPNTYGRYGSVTQMVKPLGWRALEQGRADARHILFNKIVYGLVEIPLPSYICHQIGTTKTMHPMHFIQIPSTASHYKYSFFPLAVV